MTQPFDEYNLNAVARFDAKRAQTVKLFEREELRGMLLCFEVGQGMTAHSHENEHEAFDVIQGCGTITIGGITVEAGPGKFVFVPAGTSHRFQNDGDGRWIVRATVHQRTYPRHMGKLVARAFKKRLGLVPR